MSIRDSRPRFPFPIVLAALLLAVACNGSTSTPQDSTVVAETTAESASDTAPTPADTASQTTQRPAEPASTPARRELDRQQAEPKPAPRFVTVSLPAGTELEVELLDPLSSGTNQVGDPVRARLANVLVVDGKQVASVGAELRGTVAEVEPLKKIGGQPKIAVAFDSLDVDDGESAEIVAWLNAVGKKQAARDAAKIGGGAVAGAVIGHQIDDDKGSELGALVGGAIGTAVAAKTGKEIELPVGETVRVVLESDAQIRIKG